MNTEIKALYQKLGNIHNSWEGRNTAAGQRLLCALRDMIAQAEGRSPEDVQDSLVHEEPKLRTIQTEDGYTFKEQPDGTWTDGDIVFDSWFAVVATGVAYRFLED